MSDCSVQNIPAVQANVGEVNPQYRLNYHLMGERGWINDPNGFIFYDGKFHLFYQHNPYDSVWGPMHWGHAVSADLVSWEYLPIALTPDMPYDKDGCFSGSAIEKDGKLYLIYTGHVTKPSEGGIDFVQQQCVAVSNDAITFHKLAQNPVVRTEDIPNLASKRDFRDPKVNFINGEYFMVLGSNDGAGRGQALLYTSADLIHWRFRNILAKSDGTLGDNWECPDLFPSGNSFVFMVSPQNVDPDVYQNTNTSVCMVGDLDVENGTFISKYACRMDYGFDFYAPQSTVDSNGRRIVVAWMNAWGSENPTHTLRHGWAGAMTLPREVVIRRGSICFQPISEIEQYRRNPFTMRAFELEGTVSLPVGGDSYELVLSLEPKDAAEVGLKLRVGDGEETLIYYVSNESTVVFDRNQSGIGPKGVARAPVKLDNGSLTLRVFVDRCSVEVFLGEGETVMTGLIYPSEQSTGIESFAKGTAFVRDLRKWDLKI
ncbi:beta-fructofuranosidase [Alicyclobacillus sacchari]|uniref:Sucrose-6-phosphate hydrolase n=1 Tax=Alicyclobacillus sacchari TaxID=392010 RepID=A0A4R8LCJ7_9BACL|nr:glycoside hydrolase family 32 protein [Alicyclobacillus sacchari]TDY40245.1 beta-fructofuranosidase [Alicyclobacillus sacchari]GMA59369.1 glycosyl hydrolase [Alicyclobacillus sacchari]